MLSGKLPRSVDGIAGLPERVGQGATEAGTAFFKEIFQMVEDCLREGCAPRGPRGGAWALGMDDGGDCGGEGGAWLGGGEDGGQDFGGGGLFGGRSGVRGGGLEMGRGFLGDGDVVVGRGLHGGLGGWFAVGCCAGNALQDAVEQVHGEFGLMVCGNW